MRARIFKRGSVIAALAVATVLPMLVSPATASAGGDTSGSHVVSNTKTGDRKVTISVFSPAMDRNIPREVILPADNSEPRPTLYLLNGAGGGEDTDWVNDDPVLGRQKWQTFLTQELPPVIDAEFNTNKVQSISAISMTATSVLNLAIAAPGLYKGVGAYSGCAETSTPVGQSAIELVTGTRGGADITNMWGPLDGQGWKDNDPVLNAEKLRGTELYVSTGSGLPGPHDTLANPAINGQVGALANQAIVGGVIEAAVNYCTHNLAYRLSDLKIPATFDFKPTGTHSWGYWQDDLHNSWPMLAHSLGV
jgi:diacylglycerol O-acyltransferase/trehalose O-mycolyltransferase